jgi:hypothetical protein
MPLADIQKRSAARSNGKPVTTGLAATLREAGPGISVRFDLADGDSVVGSVGSVSGDLVDLDNGKRIDLRKVKRVNLEFSSAPPKRTWRRERAQS